MTEHMTEASEAAEPAEPTIDAPGDEHTYAADELFFSTTDSSGRIRRANSIFMRLSGYPRGAWWARSQCRAAPRYAVGSVPLCMG